MPECPACGDSCDTEKGVKLHHYYKHDESIAIETSDCLSCDTEFEYYPSEKEGKYCSNCVDDIPWDWRFEITDTHLQKLHQARDSSIERVDVKCDNCMEKISVKQSRYNRRENIFCNMHCMSEYRKENWQGEDHPLWKGGEIESYGHGWIKIRREARERDDYECKVCSKSSDEIGYGPEVHHIKPVREFESVEGAHTINNVISLCPSCHSNAEHGNISRPKLYRKI